MSSPGRNGHTRNWLGLKFQRDYYCNQSLFLQSPVWKLTATKEQTLLTTSSLFQKLPLVVTVKGKLMQHQEIQLKYPRIQTLNLKIAVSVKCLNSLVIQVCKNLSCFSCYCSIVHYYTKGGKREVIVRLLKGAFSYRTCYRLPSYYRRVLLINSKTYIVPISVVVW